MANLPDNYIDSEHTGFARDLLETFYRACQSEGGTSDEINLRGLYAVLHRYGSANLDLPPSENV